jgi:hypothetical protein
VVQIHLAQEGDQGRPLMKLILITSAAVSFTRTPLFRGIGDLVVQSSVGSRKFLLNAI